MPGPGFAARPKRGEHKARRPHRLFKVYLDLPEYATATEAKEYIESAVKGMVGALHPDDPMFELDRNSVKVTFGKVL